MRKTNVKLLNDIGRRKFAGKAAYGKPEQRKIRKAWANMPWTKRYEARLGFEYE